MDKQANRLLRWLQKPAAARKQLLLSKLGALLPSPFLSGKASLLKVFFAYHPDSHTVFKAHDEFNVLFRRFSRFNKGNNAGDTARLWSFILNLKQIVAEGIEGDFAELGVWRGNTAAVLAHIAAASGRQVFLFDTFEGFDRKDIKGIDAKAVAIFRDTSIDLVRDVIGPDSQCCEFVKGYFPDSIRDSHKANTYAAVSLDCDLYEPMKAGLAFFYPRLPKGGLLLLHDYSSLYWAGAKKAIDEFCGDTGEHVILMPDKSGSAFIRKSR